MVWSGWDTPASQTSLCYQQCFSPKAKTLHHTSTMKNTICPSQNQDGNNKGILHPWTGHAAGGDPSYMCLQQALQSCRTPFLCFSPDPEHRRSISMVCCIEHPRNPVSDWGQREHCAHLQRCPLATVLGTEPLFPVRPVPGSIRLTLALHLPA